METKKEYICQICGFKTVTNGLGMHLSRSHKKDITLKEYYDKYINTSDHLCVCGKERKWWGLMGGYAKTCGNSMCIYEEQKKSRVITTGYENSWQDPKVIEEMRKRCKEKTGYDHPWKNPKVLKEREDNWEKTLGVRNPAKCPQIIKKMKETLACKTKEEITVSNKKRECTCLKICGETNIRKSKEYKIYTKKIKLERYGDENYVNPRKARETNIIKYGAPIRPWTEEEKRKAVIERAKNKPKRSAGYINTKATKFFQALELLLNYMGAEFSIDYGIKENKKVIRHEKKIRVKPIEALKNTEFENISLKKVTVRFLDCYLEINHRKIAIEFDERSHKNPKIRKKDLQRELELLYSISILEIFRIDQDEIKKNYFKILFDLLNIILTTSSNPIIYNSYLPLHLQKQKP
jgi:hypothetical protein